MFYWVVGLVGGFCAQNMYSKDDIHVYKKQEFLSLGVIWVQMLRS